MTRLDLDAICAEFLNQCALCDAGLLKPCSCAGRDYRPTMLALVREVERLRAVVDPDNTPADWPPREGDVWLDPDGVSWLAQNDGASDVDPPVMWMVPSRSVGPMRIPSEGHLRGCQANYFRVARAPVSIAFRAGGVS